jgi:hypothetical protein
VTWNAYEQELFLSATATDSATVTLIPPSIALTKTVGLDPNLCSGDKEITTESGTTVTYCFEVTNTGPVTLTRHNLVDSHLDNLFSGFPFILIPDETLFVTETALITQTTINTATWTAYNPGPVDSATASDAATVTVTPPQIAFTKTVDIEPASCAGNETITVEAGTAVTYCFKVVNTGTITLTRHNLVDSHLGTLLNNFPSSLPPQATLVVTETTVITQPTVNTATWTAFNPGPFDVISARDLATVEIMIMSQDSYTISLPVIER